MNTNEPFFLASLAILSHWEGELVDDPLDRGGRTMFGITQVLYVAWKQTVINETLPDDVANIEHETVARIYRELFWNQCGAETAAQERCFSLAYCLFDTVVQFGVPSGVTLLQKAINGIRSDVQLSEDGLFGPKTKTALVSVNDKSQVVQGIVAGRIQHRHAECKRDPTQQRFLRGWLRRDRSLLTL